jgi:hypothetical protein
MILKVTFAFAMPHYAGNALKREPALWRACVLYGQSCSVAGGWLDRIVARLGTTAQQAQATD